jgi:hypothetical protein
MVGKGVAIKRPEASPLKFPLFRISKVGNPSNNTGSAAMVNPRPLKLSNAALLHYLKNAFLEQNRLGLQKKSYF